jgi:hypothetical protein
MARQLATVSDGQDINHINAPEAMRLPQLLLRHESALAHAWARWLDARHDGVCPRPDRLSALARCLGLDIATQYQGQQPPPSPRGAPLTNHRPRLRPRGRLPDQVPGAGSFGAAGLDARNATRRRALLSRVRRRRRRACVRRSGDGQEGVPRQVPPRPGGGLLRHQIQRRLLRLLRPSLRASPALRMQRLCALLR